MMIWSVMPLELIYENAIQSFDEPIETVYKGAQLLVQPCGHGQGKIVRILSGHLPHFLDPELSPGSFIPLNQ